MAPDPTKPQENAHNADADQNPDRLDAAMDVLYDELGKLARGQLAGSRSGHAKLSATSIVHDAYVRMRNSTPMRSNSDASFLALASRAMRSVIVDHARQRGALKHGGGRWRVELDERLFALPEQSVDPVVLDEALCKLEAKYPRAGRVVEMRFFGGMTNEQVAEVLGTSTRTIEREWKIARAWLRAALSDVNDPADEQSQ